MASAVEVLKNLLVQNLVNGRKSLIIGTNRDASSFSNEYTTSQTSNSIISPSSGNKIIILGYFIHASGSIGEVDLDYSGGDIIGRCYTSQNTRVFASNTRIEGPVGEDVVLSGGGDSFFVQLNYVEVEG